MLFEDLNWANLTIVEDELKAVPNMLHFNLKILYYLAY